MTAPARVGVLGGTFDPIHLGHLAAAEAARHALQLGRVVLVPSHQPPHRAATPRASTFHRFAMASIAADARQDLLASDIELATPGPSFTAVTLRGLHAAGYSASQLFFVTGTDAFAEIATWHAYPEVLTLAHFVVISRPGQSMDALAGRLPDLAPRMCRVDARQGPGPDLSSPRILLVTADTPDISSTAVRALAREGASLEGLVTPGVERHIRRHGLYRNGPAAAG
jgi:nicotinate-nucleotide adenylyltransferase